MSTKVRAQIKSVSTENDETTITLILEKPFTTSLKDDDVFVELQTTQGNRVEFFEIVKEEPKTEIVEQTFDVPAHVDTIEVDNHNGTE